MESLSKTQEIVKKKEVLVYKFSANFAYHDYKIVVQDGELIAATHTWPRGKHEEYYSYCELNEASMSICRRILIRIIFLHEDFEELKNLYNVLNDGPIKDMVKSLQQELISKLTF